MAMVSRVIASRAMVSMAIVAHGRGSAARLGLRLGLQQVQPALLPRRELEHNQLLEGLAPACQAAPHLAAELVDEPGRAHLQAREVAGARPVASGDEDQVDVEGRAQIDGAEQLALVRWRADAVAARRRGRAALEVDAHEQVLRHEDAPLPPQRLDPHRVDGRGQCAEDLSDGGAGRAVDAQDDVAGLQRALSLGRATGHEDGHGGVALE
eukprot:scaffold15811_cov48-Phaeocystis_antarctica.AAC.2